MSEDNKLISAGTISLLQLLVPLLSELFKIGQDVVDLLKKKDLTEEDIQTVLARSEAATERLKNSIEELKRKDI